MPFMKSMTFRTSTIAVLCCVISGTAFADNTTAPTRPIAGFAVTLTAAPLNQVAFGNPVTLSALVAESVPQTVASGRPAVEMTPLVDPRLRYAFKAQMTSPCPGMSPITIGSTSNAASRSWTPALGGNYAITVHVTSVNMGLGVLVPRNPKLPDVIGDAASNYIVTGPALPANLPISGLTTTEAPASATMSAPVTLTINASVPDPGYPAKYKFFAACEPLGGGARGCGSVQTQWVTSPQVLKLNLTTSGSYFPDVTGYILRLSDCQVTGQLYTHFNYTVNP